MSYLPAMVPLPRKALDMNMSRAGKHQRQRHP